MRRDQTLKSVQENVVVATGLTTLQLIQEDIRITRGGVRKYLLADISYFSVK